MEQIVLNANLRYVIAGLTLEQRGMLLGALLDGDGGALGDAVGNIYKYIMLLQQELADKRQKMRELGAKGGTARRKASDELTADLFDGAAAAESGGEASLKMPKRKEAKEKNILNKKIKNLFTVEEKKAVKKESSFVPPLLDEVGAFVKEEGLNVDAETFVDFYDSHGWKVGQTAIRNWKATARLWHRRAINAAAPLPAGEDKTRRKEAKDDDEAYWHELLERAKPKPAAALCWAGEPAIPRNLTDEEEKTVFENLSNDVQTQEKHIENAQDFDVSPFVRFIKRIEDK